MPKSIFPILAVIGATALGATGGLFIKASQFSSLALTGFRALTPVLVLLPFIIRRGTLLGTMGSRKILWSASLLNAMRTLLFILAYKLTEIGNAIVLFYTWPVFTLIFHAIQRKKRLGAGEFFIILLAFIGGAVMNLHRDFGIGNDDIIGSLFMLGAAVLYAIVSILFKQGLNKVDEIEGLYFQNIAGSLIFLPLLLAELPGAGLADVGFALLFGFLMGICAFWLFFYALKRLSLLQFGTFSYMEVLFTLMYGYIFLQEKLTVNMAIGAVLVLISSYAARRADQKLVAEA